jgi:hypothetical protein
LPQRNGRDAHNNAGAMPGGFMALQLVVDSLDGIEENARQFYVESNGKFKLDVDGIDRADSVQAAIQREREARKEAERRLKEFGNISKDDIEELENLRNEAAKAKGADELVARERARAAKEIDAREKLIAQYRTNAEQDALDRAATELVAKHKGNMTLLKPHLLKELRAEEVDGKFVVAPANAANFDEVMNTLKGNPDFAPAFYDSGKSGGGASGGGVGTGRKTINLNDFNKLAPKDRAAFMQDGGAITE